MGIATRLAKSAKHSPRMKWSEAFPHLDVSTLADVVLRV